MSFITFGETMLRLAPVEPGTKLSRAMIFKVDYAGSESNVAASLAILGNKTRFVSKIPLNPIGDGAIHALRSYGIDTTFVKRGGDRLGTYFIEQGTSIRPSRVVYDRQHAAFSEIRADEFNWEQILMGQSWVFVSGITPALSDACAQAVIALVTSAQKVGVKVAFDLNYRRSLWSDPLKARAIFNRILEKTDLLFGNVGALYDVYGMTFQGDDLQVQTYAAMEAAKTTFGVNQLAFTIRKHYSASSNWLGAALLTEDGLFMATDYHVAITDRLGTGDAFAAGLLHALQKDWSAQKKVSFACAAFALKHTMSGDQHTSSEQEILSIMEGDTSGHIIR